jgi:hypothetical protein
VISANFVNNVVYCTIQTEPSGVIASIPVQQVVFDAGQSGPELTNLANAIEQIMNLPEVIAGTGSQTIDPTGLLADNVVFTVQYVSPTTPPSGVTAEAVVPVDTLNFTDGQIGQVALANVENIITDVYNNLKEAAGG